MKFFVAMFIYIAFLAGMGIGILDAVTKGSWTVLAISFLLYVGIMTKVSILKPH